jgi:hypothetical protein
MKKRIGRRNFVSSNHEKKIAMKTLFYPIVMLLATISASAQASLTSDIQSQFSDENSILEAGVRYYYYPNLDAYYDTTENLYIFESNTNKGQIVKAKEVPSGYRGYSLYNGIRVAITDYDGDEPFSKIAEHRKQFPKKYSSRRMPPKMARTDKDIACN